MAPARILERNASAPKRALKEDSEEKEFEGAEMDGDVAGDSDEEEDESLVGSEEDDGVAKHSGEGSEDDESLEHVDVEAQISNVSFGALKMAQDAVSRKRKRGSDVAPDQDDKLEALRKRLRQIREQKAAAAPSAGKPRSTHPTTEPHAPTEDEDSASDPDSDSAPSEEGAATLSRTSKHAPAAQTSRHQVSRKRTVIDAPKRVVRDPRFDAMPHQSHQGNSEKAYSFLVDYQKAEIAELKAATKRTKSEDEKVLLRRKINSMENKLKTKANKEREQEVLRTHRKEEREKVQQGKTPYYLKRKDLKERALVEKFKGMKGKEREKLVEKRRLKESQREKKRTPNARRGAG